STNIGVACRIAGEARTVSLPTLAAGGAVNVTLKVRVKQLTSNNKAITNTVSVSSTTQDPVLSNNSATVMTLLNASDCVAPNGADAAPGIPLPPDSAASDQKPGSVLFFNLYTSNAANPLAENTRFSLTNTSPANVAFVHLFFVDGGSCSVADAYICLTPNQT